MMRAALVATGIKELRALFPTALACTVAIVAAGMMEQSGFIVVALLGFGLGSIVIGAHSVGHEFTHRTLGTLLSQPLGRRRIYLVKLGVLAALLGALALAAAQALAGRDQLRSPSTGDVLLLVGLCGLFMAPALTMLCRSSIAGIVFTIALPGLTLVGAELVGVATFGPENAVAIDRFREILFWRVMLSLWAVCAVASWWMFARLEAIDGRGAEVNALGWLRGAGRTVPATLQRRHPIWCLVTKELHIHQMSFLLAGLFLLGIFAIAAIDTFEPARVAEVVMPLTIVYSGSLAFLLGSMASAEERQFGTVQSQLMLPLPARIQWVVKAGVAMTLSLGLGMGLPLLIMAVTSLELVIRVWPTTISVLVLTSISLYVSSLSGSGIRALVVAIPAAIGAGIVVRFTAGILIAAALRWVPSIGRRGLLPVSAVVELSALSVAVAGLAVLLLCFAHVNHRSTEASVTRVRGQVGWIAALIAFELSLLLLVLGVR
ncbi:MAG: hypothetical protein H0W08_22720 [Acidobacteria bacterium]|nr:hypothetical protein [Acidobacteriota bacterium]